MARLFIGILTLGGTLASKEKQNFEAAYHPLIMTLLEIRTTARELSNTYADHVSKITAGIVVQMQGPTIHITESIDRQLGKKVDEFLTSATRSFKDKMQRVTGALGMNIGFLYQKAASFERGVATFAQVDAPLAAYLREARRWVTDSSTLGMVWSMAAGSFRGSPIPRAWEPSRRRNQLSTVSL
jgi:hypothetical protein